MIVDDLHVFWTRIGPPEHDPPLIVDANRVLARQISPESFKAVAGRGTQGLKKVGRVHHNQFSASDLGEICRETLRDHAALKNRSSKFPLEAPDHGQYVSHWDTYCKTFRITMRYYRQTQRLALMLCNSASTVRRPVAVAT